MAPAYLDERHAVLALLVGKDCRRRNLGLEILFRHGHADLVHHAVDVVAVALAPYEYLEITFQGIAYHTFYVAFTGVEVLFRGKRLRDDTVHYLLLRVRERIGVDGVVLEEIDFLAGD